MATQAQTQTPRQRPPRLPERRTPAPQRGGVGQVPFSHRPVAKRDSFTETAAFVGKAIVGIKAVGEAGKRRDEIEDRGEGVLLGRMASEVIDAEFATGKHKEKYGTEPEDVKEIPAYATRVAEAHVPVGAPQATREAMYGIISTKVASIVSGRFVQAKDRQQAELFNRAVAAVDGVSDETRLMEVFNNLHNNSVIPQDRNELLRAFSLAAAQQESLKENPDQSVIDTVAGLIGPAMDPKTRLDFSSVNTAANERRNKNRQGIQNAWLNTVAEHANNRDFGAARGALEEAVGLGVVTEKDAGRISDEITRNENKDLSNTVLGQYQEVYRSYLDGNTDIESAIQGVEEVTGLARELSGGIENGAIWFDSVQEDSRTITTQLRTAAKEKRESGIKAGIDNTVVYAVRSGIPIFNISVLEDEKGKPYRTAEQVNDTASEYINAEAIVEAHNAVPRSGPGDVPVTVEQFLGMTPEQRSAVESNMSTDVFKTWKLTRQIASGVVDDNLKERFGHAMARYPAGTKATDVLDSSVDLYDTAKRMIAIGDRALIRNHMNLETERAYRLVIATEKKDEYDAKRAIHAIFSRTREIFEPEGGPDFNGRWTEKFLREGPGNPAKEYASFPDSAYEIRTNAQVNWLVSNGTISKEEALKIAAEEYDDSHFIWRGQVYSLEHIPGKKKELEAIFDLVADHHLDVSPIAKKKVGTDEEIERDELGLLYDPQSQTLMLTYEAQVLEDAGTLPLGDLNKILKHMKLRNDMQARREMHEAKQMIREKAGEEREPFPDKVDDPVLRREESRDILKWVNGQVQGDEQVLRNIEDNILELVSDEQQQRYLSNALTGDVDPFLTPSTSISKAYLPPLTKQEKAARELAEGIRGKRKQEKATEEKEKTEELWKIQI